MTTAYTSLLGLALPVTGELSGTWGDTVNTAITSLLDTAVAGTTSITTDADITLTTTTGASNQARQAIILWNPASGTTTRYITAPAQSKLYTVINASGGTQSIVIRGAGPTTGVTIAKGESAMVAWNGSDFVKVSSSGGALTLTNLTVTGNTTLGDAAADTLTVNATSTFASLVNFTGQVKLPSTGRSAAAALTPTNPAFLYGVASTYTDTTSSGTLAPVAPFYGIAQPTLSTSNVTTYTNAATLYIANAPAAGGSATITNPYALYVAAGANYFGGATTISVSSTSDALRITQTGSGNALLVEDSANPDSTPFVIDQTGVVVVGNTAADEITAGNTPNLQVLSTGDNASSIFAVRYSANTGPGSLRLGKSRATSVGSRSVVLNNDNLGLIRLYGDDGTNFVEGARIEASVDGTPGTNDMPGRLVFSTTADGASTPTERLRIKSDGESWFQANNTTAAVTITQTGTGNALVVEDSANPDASPFVINAGGFQINGYTTTVNNYNFEAFETTAKIQLHGTAIGTAMQTNFNWSTSASSSASLVLAKSKSGTIGTRGAVASGDTLGAISGAGDDGTNFITAANILVEVDGTPGTNDMPGRLVFSTTADGASTPTERMRIDSAGRVGVGGTPANGQGQFRISTAITGATTEFGLRYDGTVSSGVTTSASVFASRAATAAASFTLTDFKHFEAIPLGFGAGSTVTNQYGFNAASNLTGATNNYGFYSNIASGTGRWNFYANGTAANYFAGGVYVGTAQGIAGAGGTIANLQIANNTSSGSQVMIMRGSADATAPYLNFVKSRNATIGSFTIVQDGDDLGGIRFAGDDGTDYATVAAQILAEVDGTPGTNDMPGRLVFSTTADGASSPTERMRLDSSGNLGLGVTPSAWSLGKALEVGVVGAGLLGNGNQLTASKNAYYNSGWKYARTGDNALQYDMNGGTHAWYTAASGTAGNAITFTQAMTLDASGNLGLGATSVTNSRFQIKGANNSTSAYADGLRVTSNNETVETQYSWAGINANDTLKLATGGTERARITSGGYWKLGGDATFNRHEIWQVTAGAYTATLGSQNATAANCYGLQLFYNSASPNGTSNEFLQCQDNAATRAQIRSNGGLANYSANDVNLSDRREKTNFAPAKDYLDTICAIPVQTFNYIDQNLEEDDGLTLGVVAQDVQAVAPELVMESNWGSKDEPKMRLSIYQTDLQYALMKCIQELNAKVEAQAAEIAALKGN